MYLAFITESIANDGFYEKHVESLEAEGFTVRVVDCSPLLRSSTYAAYKSSISTKFSHYSAVSSLKSLKNVVQRFPHGTLAISTIFYSKETARVYTILRRQRVRYVGVQFKTLPILEDIFPSGSGIIRRLKKRYFSLNKIKKTIATSWSLPAELVGMQSARGLVVNSRTPRPCQYPVGPQTELIQAHSMDYEFVLKGRGAEEQAPYAASGQRPLAVFIEGCAPLGPDSLHTQQTRVMTEDVYYPEILRFLKKVEEAGFEVCVAAHPKSPVKGRLEHYSDWPLILGKTRQMVQMADLCLIHYSTAISYPVLYRKPVMFLTTDQINAGDDRDFLLASSTILRKRPVNISQESSYDFATEMTVDEDAYRSFEEEYVHARPDDGRLFWEIVAGKLKEYGGET